MTNPEHRRLSIATACVVVGFGAVVVSGVAGTPGAVTVANVSRAAASALAAVAALAAARRADNPDHHRGWTLVAVAAASWSIGQMVWTTYDLTDATAPFPSMADVGYLAAVPLFMAGLWFLTQRRAATTWVVALLDGLIIAGGLALVSWPLVLAPTWDAGGDSPLGFAVSLAHPIGGVLLVAAALLASMRTDRSTDPVPLPAVAVGLVLVSAARSVSVWSGLQGATTSVSLADVGWVAGFLVLFAAARHYPRAVEPGRPTAGSITGTHRAVLPLAVMGFGLVMRFVLNAVGADNDRFLVVVTLACVALILVRYLATLKENQELTTSLEEKIGELTAREQQLSHQAFHDPLTGLANRRVFADRVEHALARSGRSGDLTAVLFVDLDDFKTVNDSLGHGAGDRLLVLVANRLGGCVRPGDTVARLGGDEFGILLEEMEGPAHASEVATRILQSLEVAFPLEGRQVFTRASVGVAVADHRRVPASGAELLSDADVALYAAKGAGKSTFRTFELDMRDKAMERLELGQDLRRALEQHQFFCHYQPIVDLVSDRIVALEALVRWDHPERGLVGPAEFIELAEDSGMIGDIGMVVLQTAAWQTANWRLEGKVPANLELHVNLSGRQLSDTLLVEKVRRVLGSTGFPAQLLVFEITESVAVDVGARHLGVLEELRSLGIRFAIDDFGTGYSSLNYLRSLPVDILKIDRAFAQTVDGQTDSVLLEAIVRLGHSLEIDMIAEGIEHPDQVVMLRQLGCRRAQGFLFHRPLSVSEIPSTVTASGGSGVRT